MASITSGGWSGMKTTQSGRVLLESVNWNSKLPFGSPSCTIASMRAWPKAPRTCLLESTSRSEVTCDESSVEVLLRTVDDREPLVQVLQPLDRLLGRGLHRLTDPARHRVEPFVHEPRELGLARRQAFAHCLQPADRLGLRTCHLGETRFEILGPLLPLIRIARARTCRAGDHDHQREQRNEQVSAAHAQRARRRR